MRASAALGSQSGGDGCWLQAGEAEGSDWGPSPFPALSILKASSSLPPGPVREGTCP